MKNKNKGKGKYQAFKIRARALRMFGPAAAASCCAQRKCGQAHSNLWHVGLLFY
jgi:hypothetical protein